MSTKSIKKLILELSRLPGVGEKSAKRYAFFILNQNDEYAKNLSEAIINVKKYVKKCPICHSVCEDELCEFCSDRTRDHSIICVVEENKDILTIENTNKYNGVYHVLEGTLNPLSNVTPDKLNINTLIERINNSDVKEVILALSTGIEGQSTSMYLLQILKKFEIKITKLASGIPIGSNIEFADIPTMAEALEGRIKL